MLLRQAKYASQTKGKQHIGYHIVYKRTIEAVGGVVNAEALNLPVPNISNSVVSSGLLTVGTRRRLQFDLFCHCDDERTLASRFRPTLRVTADDSALQMAAPKESDE